MTNLLEETIAVLKAHNRIPSEVRWVGAKSFGYFSWKEFVTLANVDYDSGYGAPQVASDLLVVGNDFWLERHEYDGSEWWEFKAFPKKPEERAIPDRLISINIGWETLKEMQRTED